MSHVKLFNIRWCWHFWKSHVTEHLTLSSNVVMNIMYDLKYNVNLRNFLLIWVNLYCVHNVWRSTRRIKFHNCVMAIDLPCAEFNFIATISLPQQIHRRCLLYITFCNLWFNNGREQNVRSIRLIVWGAKIKLSIHATFSLSKWIMFSLMARTIIRHKNLDIESLHAASQVPGLNDTVIILW